MTFLRCKLNQRFCMRWPCIQNYSIVLDDDFQWWIIWKKLEQLNGKGERVDDFFVHIIRRLHKSFPSLLAIFSWTPTFLILYTRRQRPVHSQIRQNSQRIKWTARNSLFGRQYFERKAGGKTVEKRIHAHSQSTEKGVANVRKNDGEVAAILRQTPNHLSFRDFADHPGFLNSMAKVRKAGGKITAKCS